MISFLFWPRLESKCRQTMKNELNEKKSSIHILHIPIIKKNAGRYRLDFDPHYPLLLIQCLLKSYFGPQCYTWCIMAYSHEKQSKEVQMDIFRKFKICYAQGNKPHIVISLSFFFFLNRSENIYTRCSVLPAVRFYPPLLYYIISVVIHNTILPI